MLNRFKSVSQGVAIVFEQDAQQMADEYLIKKNGSINESPQSEKDAVTGWLAGDRNYYDLIKI